MFNPHTIPELAAQHRNELLAEAEAARLARTARTSTPEPAPPPAGVERWWRRITAQA